MVFSKLAFKLTKMADQIDAYTALIYEMYNYFQWIVYKDQTALLQRPLCVFNIRLRYNLDLRGTAHYYLAKRCSRLQTLPGNKNDVLCINI